MTERNDTLVQQLSDGRIASTAATFSALPSERTACETDYKREFEQAVSLLHEAGREALFVTQALPTADVPDDGSLEFMRSAATVATRCTQSLYDAAFNCVLASEDRMVELQREIAVLRHALADGKQPSAPVVSELGPGAVATAR